MAQAGQQYEECNGKVEMESTIKDKYVRGTVDGMRKAVQVEKTTTKQTQSR